MQGDIARPIYQTLLYVLSTMQGDIEYIGLKWLFTSSISTMQGDIDSPVYQS